MNAHLGRWSLDRAATLPFGFAYALAKVSNISGRLGHVDQPVLAGSRGSMVAMLSASGGMYSVDPSAVIASALEELLGTNAGSPSPPDRLISRMRHRLHELFERGEFQGAVPNGAVMVLADDGNVSGVRFGPVGVAAVGVNGVRLIHSDDRFPALREMGVQLEDIVPQTALMNPFLLAVSSVTQLDPDGEGGPFCTHVPEHGSIMLMSRGVLPLSLPDSNRSLLEWSQMESGWQYGMGGMVLQLYHDRAPPIGNMFPWAIRSA